MGGVWKPSVWQPAVFLSLGLPDASSKRGLLGRFCSYVPAAAAAAGTSPGLHLSDAEPGRELRQQQEPAAALMLEGEAGSGLEEVLPREVPGWSVHISSNFETFLCCVWFSGIGSRCCCFPCLVPGALGVLG